MSVAAAVEDAGAAEAAFALMMPLMVEEGASAPLELSRGGSQPNPNPDCHQVDHTRRRLRCRPHCHFVRMPHEKKQPVAC